MLTLTPQCLLLSHPSSVLQALTVDERDLIIGQVYRKLMEIESRLLPCGLHVVGVMPTAEEAIATLVNIAEIDRPDQVGVSCGSTACCDFGASN